jgi:hypothetical protein
MKRILSIQILLFLAITSIGQTKTVDLNVIKNFSTKDNYAKFFDRYLTNDTTLTIDDYQIIYYGQVFQDSYKPNLRHDSLKVLNKYLNNSIDSINFNKVLNYTKLILKDFPFNIKEVFMTGVAYDKLGIVDSAKIWFYKYDKLISTIMSSGDGKTQKTALIVTKVIDEYSILNALELQPTEQLLTNKKRKYYDLMVVAANDQGIDRLYFDISLFFGKW